jgi:hypothetical protein
MESVLARAARLLDENMDAGDLEYLYRQLGSPDGMDEFMVRLNDKLKAKDEAPTTQRNV